MPASKKKPRSFTFTMTKEEYKSLVWLAHEADRSMANYIRRLIWEAKQARLCDLRAGVFRVKNGE